MVTRQRTQHPADALLRARLRIPEGADYRLLALRGILRGVDVLSRVFTGRTFFALREAEAVLAELDGLVGDDLVRALLARNGGTQVTAHGLENVLTAHGLENVPKSGPVIIGSTHSFGTLDFLVHAAILLEHRPDMKVVADRESERRESERFLGPDRMVVVDRDRKDRVVGLRRTRAAMTAHLESGGALLVFGSGRVSGMADGLLVEPPWRPGITRVSALTGAPVVPASAALRNSKSYYRTRRIAGFLGGGNDDFGREVAGLRYASELLAGLGGTYNVHYGPIQPPGTAPEKLKDLAGGYARRRER